MVEMSLLTFVEFTTLYSLSEPIFGDRKPFERLYSRRKTVFFSRYVQLMNEMNRNSRESISERVCLFDCCFFLRQEYPKAKWVFRMIVSGGKRIECICSFVRFDCQIRTRINGRKTFHIAMLSHISFCCVSHTHGLLSYLCAVCSVCCCFVCSVYLVAALCLPLPPIAFVCIAHRVHSVLYTKMRGKKDTHIPYTTHYIGWCFGCGWENFNTNKQNCCSIVVVALVVGEIYFDVIPSLVGFSEHPFHQSIDTIRNVKS